MPAVFTPKSEKVCTIVPATANCARTAFCKLVSFFLCKPVEVVYLLLMAAQNLPQCSCIIDHHKVTTIQRIALYNNARCSRKGRITLTNTRTGATLEVCRTHARMAVQGFVDATGDVMCKASRSDFSSGNVGGLPADFGLWTAPGFDEVAADYAAEMKARHADNRRARARRDHKRWG